MLEVADSHSSRQGHNESSPVQSAGKMTQKEMRVPAAAGTIEPFGSSSFIYGLTGARSQSIVPSGTSHSFRTPTQHNVG
jgi:hypothetical protein